MKKRISRQELLQALDKSIEHWADNVRKLKRWDRNKWRITSYFYQWSPIGKVDEAFASFGASDCALCLLTEHRGEITCFLCPVNTHSFTCDYPSSPWKSCSNARGNKRIIASAENMLKVLRKVRALERKKKVKP